jgi:hypothetical protein
MMGNCQVRFLGGRDAVTYALLPDKKHCRSVEYKVSGGKLSSDCMRIAFTDGFNIGTLSLYCNKETQEDLFRLKINRVRVVRRADGYYASILLGC